MINLTPTPESFDAPESVGTLLWSAGGPQPASVQAILFYLDQARTWLPQMTELKDARDAKQWARSMLAYVKQRKLGDVVTLTAAEIVRRSEYRLGQLVLEGKEAGIIRDEGGRYPPTAVMSPMEFFINQTERQQTYEMLARDGYEFESALALGWSEGNLSRTNIARKVKGLPKKGSNGRSEWHYKTQRIDVNRIIREMAITLDALASSLELVEPDAVDPETLDQWADSLKRSLQTINRFTKELSRG